MSLEVLFPLTLDLEVEVEIGKCKIVNCVSFGSYLAAYLLTFLITLSNFLLSPVIFQHIFVLLIISNQLRDRLISFLSKKCRLTSS